MNSNQGKANAFQLSFVQDSKEEQIKDLLHANQALNQRVTELEELLTTEMTNAQLIEQASQYARFIQTRLTDAPKLHILFIDRTQSAAAFIEELTVRPERCLLQAVQVISDVLVQELSESYIESTLGKGEAQLEEDVLGQLNNQNERLSHLKKQVTRTMISSKQLLYSPLTRRTSANILNPSVNKVI